MGWNGSGGGSTPVKPKVTAKKPSPVRGIVAGGLVIVLAAVAYFAFFSGSEKPLKVVDQKKPTAIKEVKPAAMPKETTASSPITNAPPKKKTYIDERGIERYESGLRVVKHWPKPPPEPPGKKHIFKHSAELQIQWLLEMEPGELVLDIPYDRQFQRSLAESLKDKIEILETDSAEDRAIKEDVIAAKNELKSAMDRGEDVVQIMNDTRSELVRLYRYRDTLEQEIRAKRDSGEMKTEDVQDYIDAANLILKENGIKPLKMSPLAKRALMKQRKETQE